MLFAIRKVLRFNLNLKEENPREMWREMSSDSEYFILKSVADESLKMSEAVVLQLRGCLPTFALLCLVSNDYRVMKKLVRLNPSRNITNLVNDCRMREHLSAKEKLVAFKRTMTLFTFLSQLHKHFGVVCKYFSFCFFLSFDSSTSRRIIQGKLVNFAPPNLGSAFSSVTHCVWGSFVTKHRKAQECRRQKILFAATWHTLTLEIVSFLEEEIWNVLAGEWVDCESASNFIFSKICLSHLKVSNLKPLSVSSRRSVCFSCLLFN